MENTTPYSKSSRSEPVPRRTLQARPSKAWPFFTRFKARGFTLIELLVVISIIALLTALSASSLRLARGQAKATVCQSNLRQLGVEFSGYEAANGTLPYGVYHHSSLGSPPGGEAGNRVRDQGGWWWFNFLGHPTPRPNISPKPSPLYCPSNAITDRSLIYNTLYGHYGVNWSLFRGLTIPLFEDFTGTPLSLSRLSRASEILMIVDSGYAVISWYHAIANPPSPLGKKWGCETAYVPGLGINHGRDLLLGQKEDALDGRHPKKTVNVGYADGHVDRKKAEALLVTKTEESYTNLHPLWLPKPPSGP